MHSRASRPGADIPGSARIGKLGSDCANLKLKLGFRRRIVAEGLKAGEAIHNFFNNALVLGIIAVRDPFSPPRTSGILENLAAYCKKQRTDSWLNEVVPAEIKVIELCISTTRKLWRERPGLEKRAATLDGMGTPEPTSKSAARRTQPGC